MASCYETLAPGFLIAAPMLRDPNFDRTVVLMCLHNDEGAMGLVINRVAPLSVRDIMLQLEMECSSPSPAVSKSAMVGGPVALDSGLLLYQVQPGAENREDELFVTDELRLCPNRDMLGIIGLGQGPENFQMFLGHSGWAAGQLEQEISQGAWIPSPMALELIFITPIEKRWEAALHSQGLHPAQFSSSRPQA